MHYLPHHFYNSLQCCSNKSSMYKLNLKTSGKTVISLHQLDSRNFTLPDKRVTYSSVRFEDDDNPNKERSEHSYSYFRITIGKKTKAQPTNIPKTMFNSVFTNKSEYDNKNKNQGKYFLKFRFQ